MACRLTVVTCPGPVLRRDRPQARQCTVTAAEPPADADELALVAAGFPAVRLWRETTGDGTRYVARALSLHTHPHAVVTGSLPELTAALTAGQQQSRRP